jgi:hypothetical protein
MSSFSQTLNLQSLMSASKGIQQDNTEYIRKHKVSPLIQKDVQRMKELKSQTPLEKQNEESFLQLCQQECSYLFMQQPGIFYRLFKNELDLSLLQNVIDTLQKIEDGTLSQHDASVNIGQLIADLYTDSAIKTAQNLDAKHSTAPSPKSSEPVHQISWKEFKNVHL